MMENVRVIAGPTSWIEGSAVRQLEQTAQLPGVIQAIGMPDLHPGKGCPVGSVVITENVIYPHLIGEDIGCGMALWSTSIRELRPDRLAKKLKNMDEGAPDAERILRNYRVGLTGFESSLGTIGRGNHFAEFLLLDQVYDQDKVEGMIDDAVILLLVHSGSRGFGEQILREHTATHQAAGLLVGNGTTGNGQNSPQADSYLEKHAHALRWAEVNRRVIADRLFTNLGANGRWLFDVPHNFVESRSNVYGDKILWVHRKGAIPCGRRRVIIPGSRGAFSYLVEPQTGTMETGWSLSHGAGRKMSRSDARIKNSAKTTVEKLQRTALGSRVICDDRDLLLEEAPNAYKPIEQVIQDLLDNRMIKILATLRPVLTFKVKHDGRHHDC